MRNRPIRLGDTAQAIASQLQPVASDVPPLRETASAEPARSSTGERP